MTPVRKIVLAYSGGLDTSVILKWLQEQYGAEVVTFTADIGQGEEVEPAREKARLCGARSIHIADLREEFVRDFVFPMFRANTLYEGEYMLGTAIARPLIAKHLVACAGEEGADAVAHGATGKGNDQVRFEFAVAALAPELTVISPWREWDLNSREQLLAYAARHKIPIERKADGGSPYSMDANLLHISYEGGVLEDPSQPPEDSMWRWTLSPAEAAEKAEQIAIDFDGGDPVAINGKKLSSAELLTGLNALGKRHGIGRADIVENRYVGIKSRGCYETPGGAILLKARRALESITLDRGEAHFKDELMPRYAELIYNGYWFSPEREMMQRAIDHCQAQVCGQVRIRLYKGNIEVIGRDSPLSLFDSRIASFEDDQGAYNPQDAEGFIRLNALRLKTLARKRNGLSGCRS